MKKYTIGMIGGKGKMGRCLEHIFHPFAQEILLGDETNSEEVVKASEIVIFTVPITKTISVIEKLIPHTRKEQLLMDFTSIKKLPCDAMLKSPASVIGLHPMFGPSVKSLEGQTVVLCPVRPGDWLDWIVDLLKGEEATLIQSTPENHDRMMAVVQGLVHFTSLIFSETMKQEGINPQELFHYASPVYRMQLNIAGRIAKQSAELYRDIQFENPAFEKTLEHMSKSFENLKGAVLKKDSDHFLEVFKDVQDFLGEDVIEEGQKQTDAFIQVMRQSC